ncbi:hypothetical protein ASD15_11995 [Massilia sp. Root351]|jgi:hypothetical protein|nr:DUF6622 family protein [Massilia sp. Root351]KQV80653.1 hypothetical protein ASD15_11995 [Massilia sp. Root351]
MLQQILSHTPAYVWAILAFLVYRGVAASQDRVVRYRSVFIIPGGMLVLGLNSVATGFGLWTPAGAAWLAATLAGAALARTRAGGDGAKAVDHAAGTVTQRGSWMPLALMMAVFCCKYAVGAALAVQPALRGDMRFAVPACMAFGLFNGILLGRLLRTAAAWQALRPAAASPA